MTDEVPVLAGEQARLIWQDYLLRRGASSATPKSNPRPTGTIPAITVILGEELAAATDPRTGWTTARAYVYGGDGDLSYRGFQVVVRQRYTGITGAAGQYGKAERKNGGWDLESLDCQPIDGWTAPEAFTIDASPGPGDA